MNIPEKHEVIEEFFISIYSLIQKVRITLSDFLTLHFLHKV